MATLKQTLLFYCKVLGGISASSYGYLYYKYFLFLSIFLRCKKLREECADAELINAKKDTTRPSNVYYGLNWGFRSDNTVILRFLSNCVQIEKSIDTGDLLFFDYNCMNCLYP
jgi:hypothetical protein